MWSDTNRTSAATNAPRVDLDHNFVLIPASNRAKRGDDTLRGAGEGPGVGSTAREPPIPSDTDDVAVDSTGLLCVVIVVVVVVVVGVTPDRGHSGGGGAEVDISKARLHRPGRAPGETPRRRSRSAASRSRDCHAAATARATAAASAAFAFSSDTAESAAEVGGAGAVRAERLVVEPERGRPDVAGEVPVVVLVLGGFA